MKNLAQIFKQTSWQVLGKGVTSLSTFIILGLVARNYGQEGTGIFTLVLTYLGMFYLLGDFGLNAHVLKEGYKVEDAGRSEWRKLLGTRIVWSGVLVFIAVGLLPFLPFATPQFSLAVILGSLAIIGSGIFVTCNLIFQSRLRYDLSVLSSSFGTVISLGIFALLISQKLPAPFLLIAHLAGWILIALASLILISRFAVKILPAFDIQYTKTLVKESWPIAATLALNVLYFRADSFLLAYFKPISDVGIYNIAYSVFQSALVLPTFIMNAYYPLMLQSLTKLKLVGTVLFGLALLGTGATFLLAPLIIKVLTGEGFEGSIRSLQILSLGFPAYFLSALLMWLLVAKSRYKSMLYIYTLALIINIILNFIFIPKYSYTAASWVTVLSEYLILAMQAAILMKDKKKFAR